MVLMEVPSSVYAPVAVMVKVAPIPEAPLLYVPVWLDVLAARTEVAGLDAAMALATAVVTKAVVLTLVVLSPAD